VDILSLEPVGLALHVFDGRHWVASPDLEQAFHTLVEQPAPAKDEVEVAGPTEALADPQGGTNWKVASLWADTTHSPAESVEHRLAPQGRVADQQKDVADPTAADLPHWETMDSLPYPAARRRQSQAGCFCWMPRHHPEHLPPGLGLHWRFFFWHGASGNVDFLRLLCESETFGAEIWNHLANVSVENGETLISLTSFSETSIGDTIFLT